MSFRTFSSLHRCPLCQADHACAVTDDGLHHCHHHQGDEVPGWVCLGVSRIGFGMYRREDDPRLDEPKFLFPRPEPALRPTMSAATTAQPAEDSAKTFQAWCDGAGRNRQRFLGTFPQAASWAKELGLPDPRVFESIATYWLASDDRNSGDLLCFPECNGQGEIIGFNRRYRDGSKKAVGQRGITVPLALTPTSYIHDASSGWADEACPGPIYLVEGASDVLALVAMGRNVLGRPSATGGAEYVIEFVRRLPRDRWNLVVVGENDRKADGRWPGRAGAYRLAKRLADELKVSVRIVFPPAGQKDVRDFLKAELRAAAQKSWVQRPTSYAAVAWDQRLESADVQKPTEELRYQDLLFARANAIQAIVGLAAATLPDLHDLSSARVAAAVEKGRRTGQLPDPYAEEAAAKAALAAARKDRCRFPCCHPRYLGFLRKRNGMPWIGEVRCEKRECPGCRQWLDHRELENARLRFTHATREGKTLTRFECPLPADWKRLYAAIQRAGASFYRVQIPDGRIVVFTTFAPTKRSSWHGQSDPLDGPAAINAMQTLLALCDAGKRPCSTSHDWKLLIEDEKTSESVFIGRVDQHAVRNLLAIADTVDAVVVPRMPKTPNGSLRRCWDFLRPAGWNNDYRDHLFACWFSGDPIPYVPPSERESGRAEEEQERDWWYSDEVTLDVETVFG